MTTSLLSRTVMAAAALGISAGALAAVPAQAATTKVTRAQVLAAATSLRADNPADPDSYSSGTRALLRTLSNSVCSVDPATEFVLQSFAGPTTSRSSADGLIVTAVILSLDALEDQPDDDPGGRLCTFGALATRDSSAVLSGKATIEYQQTVVSRLSGPVSITGPILHTLSQIPDDPAATFTAAGNALKTTTSSKTVKITDKKSAAEKKAAKKKYATKLKAAKKAYAKALKKAGSNKAKKSAAKRTYAAKKASLKSSYKYSIANYLLVKQTRVSRSSHPFNVDAEFSAIA